MSNSRIKKIFCSFSSSNHTQLLQLKKKIKLLFLHILKKFFAEEKNNQLTTFVEKNLYLKVRI